MATVGKCSVKIDGQSIIRVDNFRRKVSRPKNVHKGPTGAYDTTYGVEEVDGSFDVTIGENGYEIDFFDVMTGQSKITVEGIDTSFVEHYEGVGVDSEDMNSQISQGKTIVTVTFSGRKRRKG